MQHPFRRCQSTSYLLRPGTFHATGCAPSRRGTPCASGDRISVPDGVEGPQPEGHAPGRTDMSPTTSNATPGEQSPWAAGTYHPQT